MTPVNEEQKSEFLKGMDVVEKPELEPEWADFVKDNYPNWRRHYWVDRGQWGNRGYMVGRPTAESEPVVETTDHAVAARAGDTADDRRERTAAEDRGARKADQVRGEEAAIRSGRSPGRFMAIRSSGRASTAPTRKRSRTRTRFS